MPVENKNPDVTGQVPPPEGATENKELLEKIAKMKPDELLNLYNNSQEAIKAATQRNMEAAEERKRVAAEREYWENEAKRQSEERQRAYDLLDRQSQQGRQAPTMPDITNTSAEDALKMTWQKTESLARAFEDERKASAEREQRLMSEIEKTRSAMSYQDFLKTEVYPKYPDAGEKEIDDWFTRNPYVKVEPATVIAAAQDIQKRMDDKVEAKVQARLLEKEKLAQQAQGLGGGGNAPMAALPEGKQLWELPEEEQRRILLNDMKRSGSLDT